MIDIKKEQTPYAVYPYMAKRFDQVKRSLAFKGTKAAQFKRCRDATVKTLKSLTGFDTMQMSPLRPRITERVQCDGYTRERIEIQTEPQVIAVLYALVPDGIARGERRPVVLCPHGHGSGGKYSPAGVGDDPLVAKAIAQYNYDYGAQWAKRGLITFCMDARGFGERQEPSLHRYGKQAITMQSCQYLNNMAMPLGQTVTGMWAWDMHRLLDYVATRKDCDADRIGCAGLSGGGLQTLWATALDTEHRIKAAVVSGYFYGYKESLLLMHTNCSCNYVPRLYEHVDMGDIGALIAPRPLLIETGDQDPLNGPSGLKNVKSQVAMAKKAYAACGAGKNLVHVVFKGEHKWHGERAVPWMVDQLGD